MARETDQLEERAPSKKVSALRGLVPFLRPYRRLVTLAALALVLTAAVSLMLPLAVRRVVDGFNADNASLLDQYFTAALGIAALLALASGWWRTSGGPCLTASLALALRSSNGS
jgi:ATP-binding cassette subfamily B protein